MKTIHDLVDATPGYVGMVEQAGLAGETRRTVSQVEICHCFPFHGQELCGAFFQGVALCCGCCISSAPQVQHVGMLKPPIQLIGEYVSISRWEERPGGESKTSGCAQGRGSNDRDQSSGHGFEDADSLNISDGRMNQQVCLLIKMRHAFMRVKVERDGAIRNISGHPG